MQFRVCKIDFDFILFLKKQFSSQEVFTQWKIKGNQSEKTIQRTKTEAIKASRALV